MVKFDIRLNYCKYLKISIRFLGWGRYSPDNNLSIIAKMSRYRLHWPSE